MKFSKLYRSFPSNLINRDLIGYIVFGLLGSSICFFISSLWTEGELTNREQMVTYDRMRAVAAYTAKPEMSEQGGSSGPDFLNKGTGAELTATIQSKLKEIALNVGAQINSASALKIKKNDPIALVGASLQMSGPTPSVYNFISEVEIAKPALFIDRIIIHSNDVPGDNTPKDTVLTVELDVYGAIPSEDLIGKAENP